MRLAGTNNFQSEKKKLHPIQTNNKQGNKQTSLHVNPNLFTNFLKFRCITLLVNKSKTGCVFVWSVLRHLRPSIPFAPLTIQQRKADSSRNSNSGCSRFTTEMIWVSFIKLIEMENKPFYMPTLIQSIDSYPYPSAFYQFLLPDMTIFRPARTFAFCNFVY